MDSLRLKKTWDSNTKEVNSLMELINQCTNLLSPGTDNEKLKKKLLKTADNVAQKANSIDKTISVIPDPVDIVLPFASEEFKIAWEYYLHFLEEAHSLSLASTVENKRLDFLYKISGKDEKRAIEILDFHIRQNYKPLYKLREDQLSGDEQPEEINNNSFNIKQETAI